jgi:uncharacterized protein (TIGR03435 family)
MALRFFVCATLAAGVLARGSVVAQQPPPTPTAFEVVSVKAHLNDTDPEAIALQPDGVRFTGFRVRTLIMMAYRSADLQRFDQLVGGPSWIAADRFDVIGKVAAPGALPSALPTLLQSLLRDRFRLEVHADTRSMPAFALRVARPDGRLGPELRESTIQCAADDAERWCGIRAIGGVITGRAVAAPQLAGNLAGYPSVDRYVADRTGLTGRYDFRLEYSPAFLQPGDAIANSGPSLFTALTEQLGLTLQPETLTLPVLVIDRIEKPTPD